MLKKTTHVLIESGIIKITVKENETIEEKDVADMHKVNLQLSEGKNFGVLLNAVSNFFTVSPKSRELLASKEYCKSRLATAFVLNSLAIKLMGNFFITFNNPSSPTKLFNNEKEALIWLRKFAEKK